MKRYDFIQFADVCEMRESVDGDYILHTDHAEAMAGKDVEIARLRASMEIFRRAFIAERAKRYLSDISLSTAQAIDKATIDANTVEHQGAPNAHA